MASSNIDDARERAALERLIEVRFQWEAEAENARRLSQRTSLLITIEAALLGVLAARLGAPPSGAFQRAVVAGAAIAVFSGLVLLLRPRRRHSTHPQASQLLQDRRRSPGDGRARSPLRAMRLAIVRTQSAATELGLRNVRKQRDIDRAQLALVLAAGMLTAFGLTWLFRSENG